jgi:hypothetical protein
MEGGSGHALVEIVESLLILLPFRIPRSHDRVTPLNELLKGTQAVLAIDVVISGDDDHAVSFEVEPVGERSEESGGINKFLQPTILGQITGADEQIGFETFFPLPRILQNGRSTSKSPQNGSASRPRGEDRVFRILERFFCRTHQ